MIPALLYVPEMGTGKYPAVLYADGEGKKASAEDVERLVYKGLIVMTVDLRGMGETRPALDSHGDFARYFGDHDSAETAILPGKTLAGMRAADISRAADLAGGAARRGYIEALRLRQGGRQLPCCTPPRSTRGSRSCAGRYADEL